MNHVATKNHKAAGSGLTRNICFLLVQYFYELRMHYVTDRYQLSANKENRETVHSDILHIPKFDTLHSHQNITGLVKS